MSPEISGNFESTPLWKDVESTILSGAKPTNFDVNIQIHTEEGDFYALKLLELQEKNDYAVSISGSIVIRFYLGLGDYTYKLYPFRDTLEVTVKKIPQDETGAVEQSIPVSTVRYRGILDTQRNMIPTGKRISNQDYQLLNRTNMTEVTLELQDRNLEVLRTAVVPGGIFRGATAKQLISGIMTGESNLYKVDGAPALAAFNIVKPDNSEPMTTAIIPSGLKVANIPTYVQETLKGVYSTGCGTHYQRHNNLPAWFVYPLYNTDRFNDDVERAVFYAVPQDKLSGMDRTYRKEGKVLFVAVTGQQQYEDDSQISDLNEGVGIRIPSAKGIMTKPLEVGGGRATADRSRLNTEIGTRNRRDGVFFAPMVAPSANPYKHYSQVAARQISKVNLVWENSESDLIYPGMPCKYVFMDQGNYRELKGVILGRASNRVILGAPGTSSTYKSSTKLGMVLEYDENTPQQPTMNSPGYF